MARRNRVEVQVDTSSDTKGIKNIEDAFDALRKSAPFAGAAAAAGALTATFEMAKLGASVNTVADRFTALAGSEQEADKFLRQIRQATNGTIDSMTSMQAVSKFLSMGLADNADQAAKLTSMAVALGDQTMSAGDRIGDFSALLANQSIPRLDNFGISSAQVRTRIEELQAAMPGLSREAAFNNAVLEIGAQSMERLGDSVNSQQASIDRLTAIVTDSKNAFVSWVADGIVPVLNSASKVFTFTRDLSDALADNTQQAIDAGRTWEDYARTQMVAIQTTAEFDRVAQTVRKSLFEEGMAAQEVDKIFGDNNLVIDEAIRLGVGFGDTMDRVTFETTQAARAGEYASEGFSDMGVSMRSASQDAETLEGAIAATKDAVSQYHTLLSGPISQEVESFTEKQHEARVKVRELKDQIAELEGRRYLTDDQKGQLSDLQGSLRDAQQAVEDNAAAHEEATRRILLGFLEQRLALDGLTQAELMGLQQVANEWGLLDDATLEAIQGIDEIASQFESGAVDAQGMADAAGKLSRELDGISDVEIIEGDPIEKRTDKLLAMDGAVQGLAKDTEEITKEMTQVGKRGGKSIEAIDQRMANMRETLGMSVRETRNLTQGLDTVAVEAAPRMQAIVESMQTVDESIVGMSQSTSEFVGTLSEAGERGAQVGSAMEERFSANRRALHESSNAARNLGGAMENLSGRARTAAGNLEGVSSAAAAIPRDININVNVTGDKLPGEGGAAGGFTGRTEQEFFQAGMTRFVNRPTAFNFVAGEAGAEQVTVAPLEGSRAQATGGGDTFITNVYDGGAARVLGAMIQDRRSRRLNSFMGVG